jgi:rod shape-determining protein MreB
MWGRRFLRNDIAIDLGTANTLILVKGQGVVLNEPSVLAVSRGATGDPAVVAVGNEAKSMLGRAPGTINVVRPMREGVIADFHLSAQMIKAFIGKVSRKRTMRRSSRIIICVPCESTQVERRAIREAALSTGAKDVYLIEEPMAAAMGAGLPISEAKGSMVIDIGGGTTELAVIALGGIVYKSSTRVGGDHFEEAIVNHIRRQHGIQIGERTAEDIKIRLGNALPSSDSTVMEVTGHKISEGIPRTITISSSEIWEAISDALTQIVSSTKRVLENIPAELSADIADHGIVMTGGGALMRNIHTMLAEELGLPVHIANEPMTCVVRGCGLALDQLSRLSQIVVQEN